MDVATRYVSFIESKKRKTCLLVVLNDNDNGSFQNAMFKAADTVNKNVMFYLMDAATGEWSVIIKVKDTHKTVKNILKMTPELKAIENR